MLTLYRVKLGTTRHHQVQFRALERDLKTDPSAREPNQGGTTANALKSAKSNHRLMLIALKFVPLKILKNELPLYCKCIS